MEVETPSGPVTLTRNDSLKQYSDEFKQHLLETSLMTEETQNRFVGKVNEIIVHHLPADATEVNAKVIESAFLNVATFLAIKRTTCSGGTIRKYIAACSKAAAFMLATHKSRYRSSEPAVRNINNLMAVLTSE